jgi:LPXTG-site transpeptidase (sortase) family protein
MAGSYASLGARVRAVGGALRAFSRREEGYFRWAPVLGMLFIVILLIVVVVLLETTHVFKGNSPAVASSPSTVAGSSVSAGGSTATSGDPSSSTTSIPPVALQLHPIKNPARIVIPAIKVDAKMTKVGLRSDGSGSMQVPPYGLAAWFRNGPVPGEAGPTVIIGHVDSESKPDVFNKLKDLKVGDEILIYDKNGDFATFVMDSNELVLKSELPTQRIWNGTTDPVIRLVTCGGKWDSARGHYASNLIVYGHLVK